MKSGREKGEGRATSIGSRGDETAENEHSGIISKDRSVARRAHFMQKHICNGPVAVFMPYSILRCCSFLYSQLKREVHKT